MIADEEKLLLIHFILRPAMYVRSAEENSIVAFLTGYSIGKNGDFSFTDQISEHLETQHKIKNDAGGWPGQINTYSNRKKISWVVAFKQIGLEVLADQSNGVFNNEIQDLIKSRIKELIGRIDSNGHPWFNENWRSECFAYCEVDSSWFISLWSNSQYKLLKALTRTIKNNDCFESIEPHLPTTKLLNLKKRFEMLL